jgi:anaerobic selenocysteine-containing dehydrogenase
VLSFGGALLEGWDAPVHTMRAFGEFRQGRVGRRGKLVQVEPRLSPTAAAADEWIPVHPGTEGLLAMGVAGALVAEGLFDEEFVTRRTHGFEAEDDANGMQREGLRELLAREYSLQRVSEATGVSVNVILRLARELAAARPGLAIGPRRGPLLPGRLFDHLAARQLNALVGNIDGPGGLLLPEQAPLPPLAELADDSVAAAGLEQQRLDGAGREGLELAVGDPEGLAEALLAGAPYPAEALLLVEADPAFASFAPEAFERAIESVPLVVALAGMPGDTALFSDWILPTAHFLESWDLDTNPPGVPYPAASLAQPVPRAPQQDVRPLGDALLELARSVGGPVAEAFPWRDTQSLIREQVEGLFETRRGAVIGTSFDEAWVRLMERAGWWAPGYRTAPELWNRMREAGGWWDPFYDHWSWDRVLRTDSGRYELRPDVIATLGAERLSRAQAAELRGAPPEEHLLELVVFEPLVVSAGIGAELPFLQELLDAGHEARWETWAELNPETATELDVRGGDIVRLATPLGSIDASARLTERIVPGVVAVPVGLGRRAGGRWAQGVGANPLRILSLAREPVSGIPDPEATRVRIALAERGRGRRI